jgi:hypothetical protein
MVLERCLQHEEIQTRDKVLKASKYYFRRWERSYEEISERIALSNQQKKCQMNNNVESIELEEELSSNILNLKSKGTSFKN